MKLGPIDGSTEEVRDFAENIDFRLDDYIEKPLKIKFLIIPAVILGVAIFLLALLTSHSSSTIWTLIVLMALGAGIWLSVSTQLKFKSPYAATIVAIGSLLLILIASGIFSLREAAEFTKGILK